MIRIMIRKSLPLSRMLNHINQMTAVTRIIRINSDYPEKANKHYYKLAAIVFYFLAVMFFFASFIDTER